MKKTIEQAVEDLNGDPDNARQNGWDDSFHTLAFVNGDYLWCAKGSLNDEDGGICSRDVFTLISEQMGYPRVTLQPGDFVLTGDNLTPVEYEGVAKALMNAGAERGEYGRYEQDVCPAFGWRESNNALYHGQKNEDTEWTIGDSKGRLLTPAQVLNATNAKLKKPENYYSIALYRDDGSVEQSSGYLPEEKLESMIKIVNEKPVNIGIRFSNQKEKTMTPCEEKGYKIGDRFRYVGTGTYWNYGSIIELCHDDGTEVPLFKLISGWCKSSDGKAYAGFNHIEPIEDKTWYHRGELPMPGEECVYGGHKAVVLAREGDFLWVRNNGSDEPFSVDGSLLRELFRPIPTNQEQWVKEATAIMNEKGNWQVSPDDMYVLHDALLSGDLPLPKGGDE